MDSLVRQGNDKRESPKNIQLVIYMRKTQSAGGVVVGPDGRILITNQNGNSWSLPKGHIDPGEDEVAAAKREIYEETGVRPENLRLIKKLGSYQRHKISKTGSDDKTEIKTIHMFLFQTEQTALSPTDPHNPKAVWLGKEKVAERLTHPRDKEFFRKVISELSKISSKRGR